MYNDDERKRESDESLDSETEKNITNRQIEEARYEHLIVRKHIDQERAKIDREIAELDRVIEVESNPGNTILKRSRAMQFIQKEFLQKRSLRALRNRVTWKIFLIDEYGTKD